MNSFEWFSVAVYYSDILFQRMNMPAIYNDQAKSQQINKKYLLSDVVTTEYQKKPVRALCNAEHNEPSHWLASPQDCNLQAQ